MKKKFIAFFACLAVIFMFFPTAAYSDIGPKPSVVIDFIGLENETYYATLLSQTQSTGPFTVFNELSDSPNYGEDYEIWNKFVAYEDVDGYYFLQFFEDCSDTSQFVWSYHPPSSFKILLYFPDKDSYVVSTGIYERYAFDSYYTARLLEDEIKAATYYTGGIEIRRNYDYSSEIISLFARIIGTIAIEVIIALLFGFKNKKQLLVILISNIITQSILNILLNIINYNYGGLMFVVNYLWMELVVFFIEAIVYYIYLNKYSNKRKVKKWIAPLYAVAANIASFCIGLYIAQILSGIF